MGSTNLLEIGDLGREGILRILHDAEAFTEVSSRPIPMVPALRGKTVATLFFEASTRTRLSFETAARRLSASTMSFSAQGSSLQKGESLRDTVETLDAMGVDAMVVRHSSSGAPALVANWVEAAVVNAGDGQHEHPTQALLDCYTIRHALGLASDADLAGLRVAIVGDARHSRVCRSNVAAMTALGARVVLVAPRTLLPPSLEGWPVEVTTDLDGLLGELDVCYLLRLQSERMEGELLPSLAEYHDRFGLTVERAARLSEGAVVMHPGPMNRGIEIDPEVADAPNSLITAQVRNGVAVRMAVLFSLLAEVPGDQAIDVPGITIEEGALRG
ncbi:MAG TPA: aspartate carbamoyltransferase catalytic subunit [Acidimicrobiales bacterium]|nr:aspartate carbamoyltransferase catalytic subunit [Acidimicrobiales bacterium]